MFAHKKDADLISRSRSWKQNQENQFKVPINAKFIFYILVL